MYKIILYLLLIFSFSFAETLNYKKALDLTLENNKQLKIQRLNIKESKQNVKEIKSYSYGKANLSHEMMRTNHAGYVFNSKLSSREASFKDFGFSQFGQAIDTQPDDLNYPDDRNNYTTKITYDIPLFTGFKLQNQEDILKLQEKIENIKLNMNESSLEFEVLKAYNSAVVAKKFIKATQKAKEAVSKFVESANEFHKEGLVTKIDKKQAKVQELFVKSKITEANNNFQLALAYLRFLTSNKKIDDVKELKLFNINSHDTKNLYKEALSYRNDLKIMEKNKESMKKNLKVVNASYYPSIYSHIEYGYNDDSITFDTNKDYYLATLGIKYTLFDNARSAKSQKSQIQLNKINLALNQLKDVIKLEVEKSLLTLNSKIKIYKEKKEAKELSYEVLEQSKLMYKNQLISMTDLLKQEASFRENEAALIMADYEKSLAQANLYLTIGKSLKN